MDTTVREAIAAEIAALQRQASFPEPPLMYGSDLLWVDDLDPRARQTRSSLAQDCYHRIITARGTLPRDPDSEDPGEADYGIDVASYLHGGKTQTDLTRIGSEVAAELTKDARVRSASVAATYAAGVLRLTISITPEPPEDGFTMVLSASSSGAVLEAIGT